MGVVPSSMSTGRTCAIQDIQTSCLHTSVCPCCRKQYSFSIVSDLLSAATALHY